MYLSTHTYVFLHAYHCKEVIVVLYDKTTSSFEKLGAFC